jgi:hypothetical protein
MPARKPKSAKAGPSARRSRPKDRDAAFGALLRTGAVDKILEDATARLEGGRRQYVKETLAAAESELKAVREERQRLSAEPTAEASRLARLERLIAGVTRDVQLQRSLAAEIDAPFEIIRGGWIVLGRVLKRDGTRPSGATVEFMSEAGELVRELTRLKVDGEGRVRHTYPADVVERLAARKVIVSAVVRSDATTIASDTMRVPVAPNTVHQFDLRID